MIAGRMRIPWVPVENARIARRHAHSVALASYFRHCFEERDERWTKTGEFFSPAADGGPSPAARVRDYLTPVPVSVTQALKMALPVGVQAEIGDCGSQDIRWMAQPERLVEVDGTRRGGGQHLKARGRDILDSRAIQQNAAVGKLGEKVYPEPLGRRQIE